MKFLLESDEPAPELEVIGLAINLSLNPINAQMMCQSSILKHLIKKALSTNDHLIMKLIHNISRHKGGFKTIFLVKKNSFIYPHVHIATFIS